jgi:hypothetical protein
MSKNNYTVYNNFDIIRYQGTQLMINKVTFMIQIIKYIDIQ